MDSEQKIEERKRWNAPFLRAFNYMLEEGCLEFGISQSRMTKGELLRASCHTGWSCTATSTSSFPSTTVTMLILLCGTIAPVA